MSAAVLITIGAALCFLGTFSVRVAVALAGFGGAWLLADALHAPIQLMVLVAVSGAALAIISTLVMARFMFFVTGVCVGAVVGVKIFQLVNDTEHQFLLAIIVVPAVGVLGGFVANHWRRPFLRWATAVAGAGLVLSGLGRLGPVILHELWRPEDVLGHLVHVAVWMGLAVIGHQVQRIAFVRGGRSARRSEREDA